uniref:Uncharacterized protein n=1 Tax=Monodelphis domestica TaxID=13616 RepID=A0A5F8GHM1_MONDO
VGASSWRRTKGQDNKVQSGSPRQKDTVHDNDFEPYLSGQLRQSKKKNSLKKYRVSLEAIWEHCIEAQID